jgi:putative SOS response-associated peptidase YedK
MDFESISFASLDTAAGPHFDDRSRRFVAKGASIAPRARRLRANFGTTMCGRYTLTNPDPVKLAQRFMLGESAVPKLEPRFNVAPTDPVLAVRRTEEGVREAGRLRWGLVPGRWAEKSGSRPLINARAEGLLKQPAFAEPFQERRCLIPADGFYEWRRDERGRRPFWIARNDGEPFAFAGIWAALPARASGDEGERLHSCAIVTTETNDLIRPIHDRMPVILDPSVEATWLDPEGDEEELLAILRPLASDQLALREISDAVNDVRNDGPELLEPRTQMELL